MRPHLLEESRVPVNHYLRTVLVVIVTGIWLRTLLALGAITAGADAAFGVLITDVLVPGVFLDFALLTVAYVPLRLIGWTGQGMTLGRTGYYARL